MLLGGQAEWVELVSHILLLLVGIKQDASLHGLHFTFSAYGDESPEHAIWSSVLSLPSLSKKLTFLNYISKK